MTFINPENGNELLVVLSNYEVESLFHSSNGGDTWSAVGGNLEGESGPSFRAAAIAPTDGGGSYYYAGTSIGLYMTDDLNGVDTEWIPTGLQTMGAPIIADLIAGNPMTYLLQQPMDEAFLSVKYHVKFQASKTLLLFHWIKKLNS